MIVEEKSDHFLIVHQRAHALVSFELACGLLSSYCNTLKNWPQSLLAIGCHDDGFAYTSKSYYVQEGRPKCFREYGFEEDASELILNNAKLRSSWIYALMVEHMNCLHHENEKAEQFLKRHNNQRDSILRTANLNQSDLEDVYEVLNMCDTISLSICFNLEKEMYYRNKHSLIDYSIQSRGGVIELKLLKGIFKFPFDINLTYYCIPKRKYIDDDDLRTEFNDKNRKVTLVRCLESSYAS